MGTLLNFRWHPQICLIPCFIMWGVFRMESSAYAPFWIRILSNHERAINMGVWSQSCQRQSYGCWTLLVFNCLMYATSTVLHNPCYIPLYVLAFGDPYDNGLLKNATSILIHQTILILVHLLYQLQSGSKLITDESLVHRASTERQNSRCLFVDLRSTGSRPALVSKPTGMTRKDTSHSGYSTHQVLPRIWSIQWNYMHGFIIYYSDLQGSGSNWLPQRIWLSRIYTVPIPLMIDQIDANYRELK